MKKISAQLEVSANTLRHRASEHAVDEGNTFPMCDNLSVNEGFGILRLKKENEKSARRAASKSLGAS